MTECTRPQGVTQSSDYLTATALFSSSFPFYSFFTRFPFFLSFRESVDTLFLHLFPRNPYSCQMIYFYPPSFSPLAASSSAQVLLSFLPFLTFLSLVISSDALTLTHRLFLLVLVVIADQYSVLQCSVTLLFFMSPPPRLYLFIFYCTINRYDRLEYYCSRLLYELNTHLPEWTFFRFV